MRLIIVIALSLSVISCVPSTGSNLSYESVVDGDTFYADGKKIRIWGIDAPEKGEYEYYTATLYLEVLLENKELSCNLMHIDKYKREVMRCYAEGNDIASDLVRMGMAKDYEKYSKGYYEKEEIEARQNKRGIWSGSSI